MSYFEEADPEAPIARRIFVGVSALWIVVASGAYILFGLLLVGMCHSGCGNSEAKSLALFLAALAALVASIWFIILAVRGRVSQALCWCVAAIDLLLLVLPFIFWSQLRYG